MIPTCSRCHLIGLCVVLLVARTSTGQAQHGLAPIARVFVAATDYAVASTPSLEHALVSYRLACLPASECVTNWRDSTLTIGVANDIVGRTQLRLTDPRTSGHCPPQSHSSSCDGPMQSAILSLAYVEETTPGRYRLKLVVDAIGENGGGRKIRYIEVKYFPATDRYAVVGESAVIH